jgi:hypothetical protein
MNNKVKIALAAVLLVSGVVVASKAKNALNKFSFRITGFQIKGFTAGGLKILLRSEITNDTGQSFTVNDMLCKLFYQDGPGYSEFARAASIPSVELVHATPKTVDNLFTIDLTQLPFLFKSGSIRATTFITVLGLEQKLDYDIKLTDMKSAVVKLVANASFIPAFIKNLIVGKQPVSGYQAPYAVTDLNSNQYSVV